MPRRLSSPATAAPAGSSQEEPREKNKDQRNSRKKRHKLNWIKSLEGTRRRGLPFPFNLQHKVSNFHSKILHPEKGGREKKEDEPERKRRADMRRGEEGNRSLFQHSHLFLFFSKTSTKD